MKPNIKELEAIKLAEQYYNQKDKSFKKKYLFLKFKFKSYDVLAEKTLSNLWSKFGLKSNATIEFSDEEKLECLNKWIEILYNVKFDAVVDYNNKLKNFQLHMKEYYKSNPPNYEVHISWDFPSIEKFIVDMDNEFGSYNSSIY